MQLNLKELLGLGKNKKEDKFQEAVKASFLKVKEHIQLIESIIKADKNEDSNSKRQFSTVLDKIYSISKRLDEIEAKIGLSGISTGNQGVYSNIHSFNRYSFTQQKPEVKQEIPIIKGQTEVWDKLDSNGNPVQIIEPEIEKISENFIQEQQQKRLNEQPIQEKKQVTQEPVIPILTRETLQEIRPKMVKQERPLQTIAASRQELLEKFSSLSKQELRTFLTIYDMGDEKGNASYIDVAKRLNLSEGCIRTYISGLMKKKIPVEKVKYNNKTVFLHIPRDFKDLSLKNELVSIYYETSMPQQRRLTDTI